MEFVFFTMNDFTKSGGATIRMYGILNELTKAGNRVILISNAKNLSNFDSRIEHVQIGYCFDARQKRLFQGVAGCLSPALVSLIYKKYLFGLEAIIKSNSLANKTIYFFEYLDNTIGYLLKKRKAIPNYINDLHGIATLEFKFQADHSTSLKSRLKFLSKYYVSDMLDRKVFTNALGFIFASKAMKQFFTELYPTIIDKKSYILPYVLSPETCNAIVNIELESKLTDELLIKSDEIILLFSGAFKKTGGVPDLLTAFSRLMPAYPNLRLLLVGDGPNMEECQKIVKEKLLHQKVVFIGRTPYDDLRTYQELANIIVCPDKMNMYSELIIHVKYLDALLSNKIVINGSFKSVQEINKNEQLSLSFEPSNVESLAAAIKYSIENLEALKDRYKNNHQYICENLTYSTVVKQLLA